MCVSQWLKGLRPLAERGQAAAAKDCLGSTNVTSDMLGTFKSFERMMKKNNIKVKCQKRGTHNNHRSRQRSKLAQKTHCMLIKLKGEREKKKKSD